MANPYRALSGGSDDYTKSVGSGIAYRSKQARDVEDQLNPKPAPKAPSKPASSGYGPSNPKAKYGDRPGEKRIDTDDMTKPLGSFKKGGKVKKTGVYKLHKGERVMNPKQMKRMMKKSGMKAVLSGE